MKKLINFFSGNRHQLFFIGVVLLFFYPVFLWGKIPIPADTVVGMYYPWKDLVWNSISSGVPYKNPLITDPVRQQYVWRKLAVDNIKRGNLPVWNPYSFSGTPLLANFQAAPFYPLNILYLIFPFAHAWTIQVILQPLLGGLFLFFYLVYMRVSKTGSLMSALAFFFGGFAIVWLEWNTIIQTVLWLPLVLLAKEHLLAKMNAKWVLILIISELSAISAGHLQLLFYTFLISNSYLLLRLIQKTGIRKDSGKFPLIFLTELKPFILSGSIVMFLSSVLWLPSLKFIMESARDIDQTGFLKEGWLIPWQNLIQFIAPDFFGNPATGNYWGVWNYAEFVGYIGIVPLILALYAVIFRQDKKILFFGTVLFLGMMFAYPTPLAGLPYLMKLPFISTSQPTRLIYLISLSLCILAGLGFDQLLKDKGTDRLKKILFPSALIIMVIWVFIQFPAFFRIPVEEKDLLISKRNLVLPVIFFIFGSMSLVMSKNGNNTIKKTGILFMVLITAVELFRFGWKFTPFSDKEYLFPATGIVKLLSDNIGIYRFMALDRRIIPSNFSSELRLQDVSGYDPLYLSRYNRLVGSWNRNKPDISPSSFNRIVTPQNYNHFISDLLGVKYILNFGPLDNTELRLISNEGNTYLYENPGVFPRIFFAEKVIYVSDDQQEIEKMYELKEDLINTATVQEKISVDQSTVTSDEKVQTVRYQENLIVIKTESPKTRLLVLTDMYYPGWRADIDGIPTVIHKVDFALRGIIIPSGHHEIVFRAHLI